MSDEIMGYVIFIGMIIVFIVTVLLMYYDYRNVDRAPQTNILNEMKI